MGDVVSEVSFHSFYKTNPETLMYTRNTHNFVIAENFITIECILTSAFPDCFCTIKILFKSKSGTTGFLTTSSLLRRRVNQSKY